MEYYDILSLSNMNKPPKISIIVPVYNVEKYLRHCIDSILNQSFTDFELLLIDDGSKDRSGVICDEYAAKDSRIRVFHKENGGVSSARNLGLDNTSGEWVAFVDADDSISQGFLNIRETFIKVDVLQKSYVAIRDKQTITKYTHKQSVLSDKRAILKFYVQNRNNALWDKIIRRELIGDTRFNTQVSIGEDFLFFLSLITKVNVWEFDNVGSYCYYIREGSAMQSVDLKKRIGILWENIHHVQEITEAPHLRFLQKSIIYQSYVMLLYSYRRELDRQDTLRLKAYFCEMRLDDLKYINWKVKFKLLCIKLLLKVNVF